MGTSHLIEFSLGAKGTRPRAHRRRIPSRYSVLSFPSIDKTIRVTKGTLVQRALSGYTLQRALDSSESVLGPIMRREGCSSRAPFKRTRLVQRPSKPTIRKLMLRRRLSHFLGVWRQVLIVVALVQFLPVHVRVRFHPTSFHRSIHSQRQMPRIHELLRVHSCCGCCCK
jgi:hypothetical protein